METYLFNQYHTSDEQYPNWVVVAPSMSDATARYEKMLGKQPATCSVIRAGCDISAVWDYCQTEARTMKDRDLLRMLKAFAEISEQGHAALVDAITDTITDIERGLS